MIVILVARIVPDSDIDLEKLQSGNLMTKRKNISIFLKVVNRSLSSHRFPGMRCFIPTTMLEDHDWNCEYKSDVDNDNNENNDKSRLLLATESHSIFSSNPTTWQSRGMSISRSWFMFMMMILIKEVVTLRQSKLKILPISPPFQVKSFVVTADVYCRWTIYYAGNIWKKMLMKISSQFR